QQLAQKLGVRVTDSGNVISPVVETTAMGDERARYLEQILDLCDRLAGLVASAAGRGALPLVLGGDHSVALGSLVGMAQARGSGGVVWVDAHGDLNTPETSPTGNVHGMVLAAALGRAGDEFRRGGTPVRGGLSYREAHLAMETVAESGLLDSMDVVEVNPILDRENATGQLAVELVASALGARIL